MPRHLLAPRRLLVVAALAVLAVLAGAGVGACSGEDGDTQEETELRGDEGVADEVELDAYRMAVGDCFDGEIPFAVQTVDALPCDQPHANEVFATFDLEEEETGGEEYPGDDRVQELAQRGCLVAFGEYVGNAYETSALEIGLITPTRTTWDEIDDRGVVCVAYRRDGQPLDASVEGSGL